MPPFNPNMNINRPIGPPYMNPNQQMPPQQQMFNQMMPTTNMGPMNQFQMANMPNRPSFMGINPSGMFHFL
jgi:hypothetical protein